MLKGSNALENMVLQIARPGDVALALERHGIGGEATFYDVPNDEDGDMLMISYEEGVCFHSDIFEVYDVDADMAERN